MARREANGGDWNPLLMGDSPSSARLAADLIEPSLGMACLSVYCIVLNTPRVGLGLGFGLALVCGVGEGGGERRGRLEN